MYVCMYEGWAKISDLRTVTFNDLLYFLFLINPLLILHLETPWSYLERNCVTSVADIIGIILWYEAWKPEYRSQSRRSLLSNDLVNKFPQKLTRKQ
jgi:hypothetical protein